MVRPESNKQNGYTLHTWRSDFFEGVLGKNVLALFENLRDTWGSLRPLSIRRPPDLPSFSTSEPKEVMSEHTKQKLLIEKKFGTMTTK